MLVSNHARMLAVAPGGYDRCLCRQCRGVDPTLARSARRIETRLLADEIAEALVEVAEDAPKGTLGTVGTTFVAEYDDYEGTRYFTLTVDDGFASAEMEDVPTFDFPWDECDWADELGLSDPLG